MGHAQLVSTIMLFIPVGATHLPAKSPSWLLQVTLERSWFFRMRRNETCLDFIPFKHIWLWLITSYMWSSFCLYTPYQTTSRISKASQDAVFILGLSCLDTCSETRSEPTRQKYPFVTDYIKSAETQSPCAEAVTYRELCEAQYVASDKSLCRVHRIMWWVNTSFWCSYELWGNPNFNHLWTHAQ